MAGILTKGVQLSYKTSSSSATYTDVKNVQEFPDMGSSPEQVDITTLDDNYMHYIPGLKDLGTLEFTLLFDNSDASSNYRVLRGLEEAGDTVYWQVEFPDATNDSGHGTQFQFTGKCAVAATGKGVNEALTFSLSIFIDSDIVVVNPS